MARIRTLKPEFFQDEALAACSPHARLLAVALLQLCDRQGVFRNIPMQVHAHAFPWEGKVNVPALLGELEAAGYLSFYSVDGKGYGFVPGFTKHQSIGGKEAQSPGRYPLPDQADTCEEAAGKSPGSDEALPREAKGTAGKGKGIRKGEGKVLGCEQPDTDPPEFIEFQKTFPKRSGSHRWRDALSACKARLREGYTWDEIIDGARRYAVYAVATNKAGTEYALQAATFVGPNKQFLEPWTPPKRQLSPIERVLKGETDERLVN